MKIFLTILLVSTLICAKELTFTKKQLNTIKNHPQKKAILKRIDNYLKLQKKIVNYNEFRKLSHINSFFNQILPQFDKQKFGIDDYWSTRKEFFINGRGDCEDYVIAKYFSLIENDFDKKRLFLAVVKVKGEQTDHMVLLYFKDFNKIPLVLDNLSFKVLPLNKRPSLSVKFIFNEYNSYLMENNKISKKVRIDWKDNNKWEKLLNKVYKNNE